MHCNASPPRAREADPLVNSEAPTPSSGEVGRVVVVGSLNVDLTVNTERFPQPGETLTASELRTTSGGKSSNQAVAAAILGSAVQLIGAVGADNNGNFLLGEVAKAGVDVSEVQQLPDHATGSAMIVVNANGENTILVSPGANGALSEDIIDHHTLHKPDVLCLCLEVPDSVVVAAANVGHRCGAQVLLNLSPYRDVPAELLDLTDILIINESEANLLLDTHQTQLDWPKVLDMLGERGIQRAVVTCGAGGSVVLDATATTSDKRVITIEAEHVDVVDTTGCGDAYTGALAHKLATDATLDDAARLAAKASAKAATAPGTQTSYHRFAHLRT